MPRKQRKKKFGLSGKERIRNHRNIAKILKKRNESVAHLMQSTNRSDVNLTFNSESLGESSIKDVSIESIQHKLTDWTNEHFISKRAVNHLLSILNSCGHILPKDYRTLLKTDTNIEIVPLAGGSYWHNGLKKCLTPLLSNFSEDQKFFLNFNIDGLPLYQSSKQQFWPILANIHGTLLSFMIKI